MKTYQLKTIVFTIQSVKGALTGGDQMATKKSRVSPQKSLGKLSELHAIRVGEFKPSLQTLSSLDCGVDLSGYAFEGLKKWK